MTHTFSRRLGALLLVLALSLSLAVPAWAVDTPAVTIAASVDGTAIAGDALVEVGATVDLTATLTPGGTTVSNANWQCQSPNTPNAVITTNASGSAQEALTHASLTAQGVGTVTVDYTADLTAADGTAQTGVTASFTVTFIPTIELNQADTLSLSPGATRQLTASVRPAGQVLTWSSSDDAVATVSPTGLVTAVGPGNAAITASVSYGSGANEVVSAVCNVTVGAVPVGSVSIITYNDTNNPLILAPNGRGQVRATVSPITADQAVTWSSSDTGVAEVNRDTGVVLAHGVGRAILTAAAGDKSASCAVEVSGIRLVSPSSTAVNLLVGQNITPAVESYGDAKLGRITNSWRSNDPLVAAVESSTGRITGRAPGETDVTLTYTADGVRYYIDNIRVTVSEDTGLIHSGTATAGAPYVFSDIMTDLNAVCRSSTGYALSYITNVMVPTSEGVLYYNHVSNDDTGFGVGATERYYYDESTIGERYMSGLTFVPNSDFNGITTITYTGYNTQGKTYLGKIRLTVTGSGNVTFITKAGEALAFNSSGFSAASRSVTGREINNVSFTLPEESKGTLYYGYTGAGDYRYTVTEGEDYFRSRTPYLDQVNFVPAEYYIGTLTLPFNGVDTAGSSFRGKLHIIVVPNRPDGERSELTTTALRGTTVDFDKFDFQAACQAALGQSLSYVRFTPPPSSAGTLYYNYSSSGRYDSLVNANTRYYPSRTPKLDDLTFVPSGDRIQPVTIDFVGYTSGGRSFDGTVTIYYRDAGSVDDVISYAATSGQAIPFEPADFDALCENVTGKSLSRIEFQYLPDSDQGTLFRNYNTSSSTGTRVTTKDKIYRSSLSSVAFAPKSDYVGTVELEFNGYTADGTRFTGTVRINVEEGNTTLRYSVYSGSSVDFNADDFNTVCKQATDGRLNYVRFVLPTATEGRLYYRPSSSSTSKNAVSASSSYYYSTSGSNKLDNVFFTAAANYTGTVSIDYTGFSTSGARFTGTVEIDVSYHNSTTLYYTTTSVPFNLPAGELFSACSPLLDREISYVLINALPKAEEGKLYYDYVGYNTGTAATTSTKYYRDKASYLNRLVFVPKEGFTGTVCLPYTVFDTRGGTVSGTVNIEVTAPDTSVFSDMGGHVWAIPSVDFLYASGVVEGVSSTQYEPAGSIKRGDFVLMLYRMFNLRAAGTSSFSDVPADSYYAAAIASAKAQNVVTGENGRFRPEEPITRQDAMVYLRNAMRAAGKSVPAGSTSELYAFADYNSVSSQARSAVISMVHMGIIKGDDHRRLNPGSPISRAEMAVLIHRTMTL